MKMSHTLMLAALFIAACCASASCFSVNITVVAHKQALHYTSSRAGKTSYPTYRNPAFRTDAWNPAFPIPGNHDCIN
eukprot:scaffold263545_cov36-Attheya_sp.AAC.2